MVTGNSRVFFAILFTLLFSTAASAQKYSISGKVIDSKTLKPLPFVNFTADNSVQSGSTDIDGRFAFTSTTAVKFISFTYVGYEPYVYYTKDSASFNHIIVLKPKQFELREAVVVAGENPAYRIIRKVIANKDKNDPEKALHSFSYMTYSKLIFDINKDSLARKDSLLKTSTDTASQREVKEAKEFVDKNYLFMMESISSRKFLKPDRNNEEVLASKVSGFQDPMFTMLAMQLQSFDFYKESFSIFDKEYFSPISSGGIPKYSYLIEDTVYSGKDSVFIISFKPKRSKNFDGMKGVLYINTNGYAVQNVISEPNDKHGIHIKVQQKYEFLENRQWFPTQLNTEINMGRGLTVGTVRPLGVGHTYIKEIELDPELKKREFSRTELKAVSDASSKPDDFWNKYRADTLTEKEMHTYHSMDSIGKKENFNRNLKAVEIMLSGKIPLWKVDLDIDRFVAYNRHEGFRLGAGAHTSDKISEYISVGGYGAYGFTDKVLKYGGDLILKPFHDPEIKFKAAYVNDVLESGGTKFYDDNQFLTPESYRNIYVNTMDKIEKTEISGSFVLFQYVKANLFLNKQTRWVTPDNPYSYGQLVNERTVLSNKFNLAEAGLSFRFAYGEKFINTGTLLISNGTKYPVLWMNVSKGFSGVMNGDFDYFKVDGKIEKEFLIRSIGRPSFQLNFGFVDGKVPYSLLNNGKGSFIPYTLSAPNSFETMGMNEFLSSRYVSLFFTHAFNHRMFRIKKFRPYVSVVSKVGFGQLDNPENHFGIPIKTMEKGYFESGLVLDNLIRYNVFRFGVAGFYRYGPYANPDPIDNLAIKFTLGIAL